MDAVDGVGGDADCAVEAESDVGPVDIVVDGLGQVDDVQALFPEEVGRLLGPVAAQDDEAVQLVLLVAKRFS